MPPVGTEVGVGLPTDTDEMGLLRVAAALEELATPEVANVIALAGKAVPTPALIPVRAVDLLHVASERPDALDDPRTDLTTEQVRGGGRPVIWSLARVTPFFDNLGGVVAYFLGPVAVAVALAVALVLALPMWGPPN